MFTFKVKTSVQNTGFKTGVCKIAFKKRKPFAFSLKVVILKSRWLALSVASFLTMLGRLVIFQSFGLMIYTYYLILTTYHINNRHLEIVQNCK